MADNSLEVQKDVVPFHPCLTPRGSTWYNLNILTPLQQKLLNELKIEVVKENQQYLARHPEIRALIALFLREVLMEQPKLKTIADFAKDFFSRSQIDLQLEIDEYLLLRGEPCKKDGDSALNVEVSRPSSIDDITSLFHQYYTYVSYTDVSSPAEEEAPEWSSYEDIEQLHRKPTASSLTDQTYTTSTDATTTTDSDYERRQFELLFASRASLYSGETSLEASTIDLTKEYMAYFGGVPPDQYKPKVHDYDDEDKKILKEIRLSEEINDKLSIIIENIDEEEQEEEVFEYEQMHKRLVLEMDLESLKERLDDDYGFQGETGPRPSQNESFILERMLDYTIGAEG